MVERVVKMPAHPRFATAIAKATANTLAAAVCATYLSEDDTDFRGSNCSDLAQRVCKCLQEGNTAKKGLLDYAGRLSEEARNAVKDVLVDNKKSISEVSNALGEALLPGFIDLVAQRKSDASYGGSMYMLSPREASSVRWDTGFA
jgi:hypothetical protein